MPSSNDYPQKKRTFGKTQRKKGPVTTEEAIPEKSPKEKRKKGKPTKTRKPVPTKESEPLVDKHTPPLAPSGSDRMDSKAAGIYLGGESSPISEDTLSDWRYRRNGKGPRWIKVGRLVRYTKADLDAYLASRHMGE